MSELPAPPPEYCQISEQLCLKIKQKITSNGGKIPFAEYMNLALYTPSLGYYRNGLQKFGPDGDFITAPDQFPLFSQTIGKQCCEIIANLRSPATLLELGPGSGKLALHLLQTLQAFDCVPEKYYLLEPCKELADRQQALLEECAPDLVGCCEWLTRLPEQPFTGIVLANEVIDAMPVSRFALIDEVLHEMVVVIKDDQLASEFTPITDPALLAQCDKLLSSLPHRLKDQYATEINTVLPAWLHSLSDCLSVGVMLFIDYGFPAHEFYHPDRNTGTFMCHYQQRNHSDAFHYPGLQDLTSHVDFTALANAADEAGLEVAGYTSQAMFLLSNGIVELTLTEHPIGSSQHIELTSQIKILTHPHEMGELFKFFACTKNYTHPLAGFSVNDKRARL